MAKNNTTLSNFLSLYDRFDTPVVPFDCGEFCAPHNIGGKPFCCDICHAVPFAYTQEWAYLEGVTDLWHLWRGDECVDTPQVPGVLLDETPNTMCLLACLGPDQCQRQFRSLSCRQFPFFPFITSQGKFLGLTYNMEFEDTCWVISNLDQVTPEYVQEFVQFYDDFFSSYPQAIENYTLRSNQLRENCVTKKRSITILHRDGGYYLMRPINERLRPVQSVRLPQYGVYRKS